MTRSFLCDDTTLAPVGDMLSHSSTPNMDFDCTPGGDLTFTATADIKAGDELTASYHEDQDAKDMLIQYGMTDGASFSQWSEHDCKQIHDAHLDPNAGELTKNVIQLVERSCPAKS